jgi:2',3'-cyclic-nucleotide 2'-phosphodiesterase (5'-nucleotidase family)
MRMGLSFSFCLSLSLLCVPGGLLSGCKGKDSGEDSASTDTDDQTDDTGTASDDTGTGSDTGTGDGLLRLTILHTNDWQSHMLGQGPNAEYSPDSTNDDSTIGGLARMSTLVSEIRGATDHPVVLYDGGDWMAGALFQLLATTHAAELQAARQQV